MMREGKVLETAMTNVEKVNRAIQDLGDLVEKAIAAAIRALLGYEKVFCESVIAQDRDIDRKEIEVEEQCFRLLCENQIESSDVRNIVAILKINNDLERIGDLAVNVAKTMTRLIDVEVFNAWEVVTR